MVLDTVMLGCIAIFVFMMLKDAPKSHYDVNRAIFPLKGIDISAHNGNVDFPQLASDTVSFVMIKATEGGDFCDGNFNVNYRNAKDAGLKVGAYHFFRFDSPGAVQAQHFLGTLEGRELDFPLAIDVEKWGNPDNFDENEVRENLRYMVDAITDAGYPVILYTNKQGYNTYLYKGFSDVPLWICSLSNVPPIKSWKLWQHSHDARIKGAKGAVDLNTFNGDVAEFSQWTIPYVINSQKTDIETRQ